MKKLALLIVGFFVPCFIQSCSVNHLEDIKKLTNEQLYEIINKSNDVLLFVNEKQSELRELKLNIEKWSEYEKKQIDKLYAEYRNYEEFVNKNNSKDIEIFNGLIAQKNKNYKSIPFLKNVLKNLTQYNYDNTYLLDLLKLKLQNTNITPNNRTSRVCDDIYWEVYIYVLNYNYFELGTTLEEADLEARTAASWAYVGCVRGKQ